MAKIIEFYIPGGFRQASKWVMESIRARSRDIVLLNYSRTLRENVTAQLLRTLHTRLLTSTKGARAVQPLKRSYLTPCSE